MLLDEALEKLKRYCAYQDRCHQEVRTKLLSLKVYGDDLEEIISELISDNFLNEERFARSFARGKFRLKSWGRNKIVLNLKQKNISDYCIRKALAEIEEDDYVETLASLINKQRIKYDEGNTYELKQKLARYLINKGFEPEIVWEEISRQIS